MSTVDRFRHIGVDIPAGTGPTIQNIVTSGDLGQQFDLSAVAIGLGLERTEYEPELFPGLIYRSMDLDITMMLFGSRRFIVVGATDHKDNERTIEQVGTQLFELNLVEWSNFYCENEG